MYNYSIQKYLHTFNKWCLFALLKKVKIFI